ncbi:hypothetical protein F5I97DRAFT_925529 [Phlebopus sp. FC_14]|nr:hypothetical protein F5I97DRAFT_925529 [Phlebopus sp. FC_14]
MFCFNSFNELGRKSSVGSFETACSIAHVHKQDDLHQTKKTSRIAAATTSTYLRRLRLRLMEDAQPNEVRLSRKGSTTVPLIRSTCYGQGRGHAPAPFRGMRQGTVNTSANHSGSQFTSSSRRRDASFLKPTMWLASPPSQHSSTNDPRQDKKRKVDGSLPCSSERQEKLAKQWSNAEIRPKREYVTLKLPSECRRGIPGSHRARNTWIQTQKQYLGTERGLSVVDFNKHHKMQARTAN